MAARLREGGMAVLGAMKVQLNVAAFEVADRNASATKSDGRDMIAAREANYRSSHAPTARSHTPKGARSSRLIRLKTNPEESSRQSILAV